MPFVLPTQVVAKLPISRFKTVDETRDQSDFCLLQKRKKPFRSENKPLYRIVTTEKSQGCRYLIARENSLEALRRNEWHYCTHELPCIIPPALEMKERTLWLIAHFTEVALLKDGDEHLIDLSAHSSPLELHPDCEICKAKYGANRSKNSNTRSSQQSSIILPQTITRAASNSSKVDVNVNVAQQSSPPSAPASPKQTPQLTSISSQPVPSPGKKAASASAQSSASSASSLSPVLPAKSIIYSPSSNPKAALAPPPSVKEVSASSSFVHASASGVTVSSPSSFSRAASLPATLAESPSSPSTSVYPAYAWPKNSPSIVHSSHPTHDAVKKTSSSPLSSLAMTGSVVKKSPSPVAAIVRSKGFGLAALVVLDVLLMSMGSDPRIFLSASIIVNLFALYFLLIHLPKLDSASNASSPRRFDDHSTLPPPHQVNASAAAAFNSYQQQQHAAERNSVKSGTGACLGCPIHCNSRERRNRRHGHHRISSSTDAVRVDDPTSSSSSSGQAFPKKSSTGSNGASSPLNTPRQMSNALLHRNAAVTGPNGVRLARTHTMAVDSEDEVDAGVNGGGNPRDADSDHDSDGERNASHLPSDRDSDDEHKGPTRSAGSNAHHHHPHHKHHDGAAAAHSAGHSSSSSSSSSSTNSFALVATVAESEKLEAGISLKRVATCEVKDMPESTWTNIHASTFQVRIGPNYAKNKKKHPSKPAIFDAVAIDLYQSPEKIMNVGRLMKLPGESDPELKGRQPCGHGGCTGLPWLPSSVLINFQIPNYPVENVLWGKKVEDGPGMSLVFHYTLSQEARAYIRRACTHHKHHPKAWKVEPAGADGLPISGDGKSESSSSSSSSSQLLSGPPATCDGCAQCLCPCIPDERLLPNSMRLLRNFVDAESGSALRQRLKAIVKLVNADDAGLGGVAKKLVTSYNGTPFLIRTTSVFWRGEAQSYFEIDVDVHRFSYPARVGLSGVRERIKDVIFDFAFVVEGVSDDELPEQILAAARLARLDMAAAMHFPAKFLAATGSSHLNSDTPLSA